MQVRKNKFGWWLTLALLCVTAVACKSVTTNPANSTRTSPASQSGQVGQSLRVLSWNVGEVAFVENMSEFHSLVGHNRPDILLLHEVKPTSNESLLRQALPQPANAPTATWHIDYGASGGRQRGVIVSRFPLEYVPEFDTILAYPRQDHDFIATSMGKRERNYRNWTLQDGIAANAAIALADEHRILVVTLDLQCCGDDPASWQEYRRRVEVREVRKLIKAVLKRTEVDAIIVAGDFNVVSTPLPLVIISNLDDERHLNLSTAEAYQSDGGSWTWDGRGTKFPSRAMDFQLYSGVSLQVHGGFIFNSELLSPVDREQLRFKTTTSRQMSDHLPVVVDYQWK